MKTTKKTSYDCIPWRSWCSFLGELGGEPFFECRTAYSVFSSFWNWLMEMGGLPVNPASRQS